MELSEQLRAEVALTSGNQPSVSITEETGWHPTTDMKGVKAIELARVEDQTLFPGRPDRSLFVVSLSEQLQASRDLRQAVYA